jgi:hypothetical protein
LNNKSSEVCARSSVLPCFVFSFCPAMAVKKKHHG